MGKPAPKIITVQCVECEGSLYRLNDTPKGWTVEFDPTGRLHHYCPKCAKKRN